MKIFQDIPSGNGDTTIREAIAAILERAQELHLLSRKWSLAELQLDADDFAWLCDWACSLSGKAVQLWLEELPWHTMRIGNRECTYSAALGTLLLLFTAETARRKATEGFLWSIFQQDCFLTNTTHVLFVGGQPTRAHKDALEEGPGGSIYVTSLALRDCKTGSIQSTYNSVSHTGDLSAGCQSGWLGKGEHRLSSTCLMGR